LLDLKNQGQVNDGIEVSIQALKDELDLDLQELIAIQTNYFIDVLKSEKGFTNGNLNKLADILLFIADNRQGNDKKLLLNKCLTIYEYLEKADKVYSFDRRGKIERIKKGL
jgi:hypothetical protein